MSKKRSKSGRAIFYSRDSGGRHETTPSEYIRWAQRQSKELGLRFSGTAETIESMIRSDQFELGDIFFDYCVKGNVLSRNGLNALISTVRRDESVSHILIPRRDRLMRPNDPLDGMELERTLRGLGVTLVFNDVTLGPQNPGSRPEISEAISGLIAYDRAGADRRSLAEKIIFAQLKLAKAGYSTGGRAPFGFRRWLVHEDGTKVRKLQDGERVRRSQHHVVWLPESGPEWEIIRRILKMLKTMPASRVARILTEEKIPTPDHGRYRTDNGIKHRTSGAWHQSTIVNIARNPLLLACVEYGKRGIGDQLRFTKEGPRELSDTEFNSGSCTSGLVAKPKVTRNAESDRIVASALFNPLVDVEEHKALIAELDARAGTQKGKPRSRDPNKNPLGARIFDANCGWPLYRQPYGKTFRYTCGKYQQSHGAACAHNNVEGFLATRFVLSCIRQFALSPLRLQKIKKRIGELATTEMQSDNGKQEIQEKSNALSCLEDEIAKATQNLARAESDEQYAAIAGVFDQLSKQRTAVLAQIEEIESRHKPQVDMQTAVNEAMAFIDRLAELADNREDLSSARQVFDILNARLFLSFRQVKPKKRVINKVSGGIVTFGDAHPPIPLYDGPTARNKVKPKCPPSSDTEESEMERKVNSESNRSTTGGEEKSLGNVNRGDWI